MTTEQQTPPAATSFSFESIILTTPAGEAYDITELVFGFTYYEDINKGFMSGNLRIIDSGSNLRSNAPISGYDRVEIKVNGPDEQSYVYNFFTYSIRDVVIAKGKQTYNLGLITKEALLNEGAKVSKKFNGMPHTIVKNILTEYLEVDEADIFVDETKNDTIIVPNNRNPFTICSQLANRSITDDLNSAGCFFFKNANGFNFRSINTLCNVAKDAKGDGREIRSFVESMNGEQIMQYNNILNVAFTSEVNVMEGLRMGAYSSELQTFNIDTGEFNSTKFSLDKEFDTQKHLGSNTELTSAQKISAKTPSRITSAIISNEVNYSGQKEGKEDATYKDWTDKLLLQTFSRNYILNTQGLRIEVPGNLDLVVGDRVNVTLFNSVSQDQREEDDVDINNSGFYLITKLSRMFDKTRYNVTTVLKLQRDTFGYEPPSANEVLLN